MPDDDRLSPLYAAIARRMGARKNCIRNGVDNWRARHEDDIRQLVQDYMPARKPGWARGKDWLGFDHGTQFDFAKSGPDKLVFVTDFRHSDTFLSTHRVIVRPSFYNEIDVSVTGRDVNAVTLHIETCFTGALRQMIDA